MLALGVATICAGVHPDNNPPAELLTTLAMYDFGAIALAVLGHKPRIRYWAVFMTALAAILLVTEPPGPNPGVAHMWEVLAPIAPTAVLITAASIAGLRSGRPSIRAFVLYTLTLGLLTLGYVANTAFFLITRPTELPTSYQRIIEAWSAPALIMLTLAGLGGLIGAHGHHSAPSVRTRVR